MHRKGRIILIAAMLISSTAINGCNSSAKILKHDSSGEEIRPDSVVALTMKSSAESESQEALEEMRARLYGLLVSQGIFAQVVAPTKPADYRMLVVLSGVDEVSQGARIFFGVFAGSNEVTAHVKLTDMVSDREIASFVIEGESASHPMSSESDMEDAVREVTSRIVQSLNGLKQFASRLLRKWNLEGLS